MPRPRPRGSGWPQPLRSILYRNNHDGTFIDVTPGSGLEHERYVLGVCAGDYDNDGDPDLYLTALGGNRLFRNRTAERSAGAALFEDVTSAAGVTGKDLSTGAAWLDYDRDGRLDLFVCRYMDYTVGREAVCRSISCSASRGS